MKRILTLTVVFALMLTCGITLSACGGNKPKTLATPILTVNGTTVSWAKVDNAKDYTVNIDGTDLATTQTALSYSFTSHSPDDYVIKVRANTSNTKKYNNSEYSEAKTVTVSPIVNAVVPSITAEPTGATYDRYEDATALSVTASASDSGILSYQWYKNTVNSTTGGTAVGTNSNTYTPSTTTAGTLYYYVIVTNTNNSVNGTKTATKTSNAAAVTITNKLAELFAEIKNVKGKFAIEIEEDGDDYICYYEVNGDVSRYLATKSDGYIGSVEWQHIVGENTEAYRANTADGEIVYWSYWEIYNDYPSNAFEDNKNWEEIAALLKYNDNDFEFVDGIWVLKESADKDIFIWLGGGAWEDCGYFARSFEIELKSDMVVITYVLDLWETSTDNILSSAKYTATVTFNPTITIADLPM